MRTAFALDMEVCAQGSILCASLGGLDNPGFSFFHDLVYFHIRRGSVHNDFCGFPFTNVIHGLFYGVRSKVFHGHHAQMTGLAVFLPLPKSINRLTFTITRTFVLRWLPLPRLSVSSPSRSSSVVKWASFNSATPLSL